MAKALSSIRNVVRDAVERARATAFTSMCEEIATL